MTPEELANLRWKVELVGDAEGDQWSNQTVAKLLAHIDAITEAYAQAIDAADRLAATSPAWPKAAQPALFQLADALNRLHESGVRRLRVEAWPE